MIAKFLEQFSIIQISPTELLFIHILNTLHTCQATEPLKNLFLVT